MKKLLIGGLGLLGLILTAGAANAAPILVNIDALAHSSNAGAGAGLDTGIAIAAGDRLVVSVDSLDTWSAGAGATRTGNADGLFTFAEYLNSGFSFRYGSLIGRIDAGDYFFVGTNFDQIMTASGNLKFYYWDSNFSDNSGSVDASLEVFPRQAAEVPEPQMLALFGLGLLGVGLARRRRA